MARLLVKDLGEMEYLEALALQEKLLEAKREAGLADLLLFVEHPHVFTIGRGGEESNVLCPEEAPVYRTSRGGDVTYHGPGQMVVYPLLDLRSRLRRDVHRYLRNIEIAAIRTIESFGLKAERRPPWTGVWIGERKIASIGIAVRRGITYHGLALNVNTDLSYFSRIVPCGLSWAEMTSMQKELGQEVPLEEVKKSFLDHFVRRFRYAELKELCQEDIQIGSKSGPPVVPATSASNGF
ncbi:MAG: lipoyl(octanoyl) transferase LipB [Deltaproteobacteria bacterium]|nr:lipoyl(octanoyl) transferase LipB [Deltaproteobacteria bacterium]